MLLGSGLVMATPTSSAFAVDSVLLFGSGSTLATPTLITFAVGLDKPMMKFNSDYE